MFFALAVIAGIAFLVCWIMVVVKIFQSGQTGLGILGIFCPLFTFIYGWVKVNEFGIKNLMTIWSIAIGVGFVANLAGGGGSTHVQTR